MKIASPLPPKKARLEIVPLIDIMFFLLASFMLVSLTMTKQRTVKVNLPGAKSELTAVADDAVTLAVAANGQVYLEKQPISLSELRTHLQDRLRVKKDLPIYISGDAATPHAAMVAVLDHVRRCGVTKVAFNTSLVEAPTQ